MLRSFPEVGGWRVALELQILYLRIQPGLRLFGQVLGRKQEDQNFPEVDVRPDLQMLRDVLKPLFLLPATGPMGLRRL